MNWNFIRSRSMIIQNQIMIGHDIYTKLYNSIREYFVRLDLDESHWNYRSRKPVRFIMYIHTLGNNYCGSSLTLIIQDFFKL